MFEDKDLEKNVKNPYSDTIKVILLSNKGDILTLTDINKNELAEFIRLRTFSSIIPEITDFVEDLIGFYIRSKISIGRKGRKEILRIGQGRSMRLIQNMFERMKTLTGKAGYGEAGETENEF